MSWTKRVENIPLPFLCTLLVAGIATWWAAVATEALASQESSGSTGADPDLNAKGMAIVHRALEKYRGMKTYRDEFETVWRSTHEDGSSHEDPWGGESGSLQFARSNRVLLKTNRFMVCSDGDSLWTYYAPTGRYTLDPAPDLSEIGRTTAAGVPFGMLPTIRILANPQMKFEDLFEDAGRVMEVVSETQELRRVTRVTFLRKTEESTPEKPETVNVWIDDATRLLVEFSWGQWAITHGEADENGKLVEYLNVRSEHVIRIRSVEIDTEIPLDRFRFKPKPGDRRAKRFINPYSGQGKQAELEGQIAPSFSAETIKGKRVSIPGADGEVVLLHFWSSCCAEDHGQLQSLQRIADRFKDRPVIVLGIHSIDEDGTEKGARKTLTTKEISFPQVMDSEGTTAKKYHVEFFPCTYLLDKRGIVRDILSGSPKDLESEMEREIEILLRGESLFPPE